MKMLPIPHDLIENPLKLGIPNHIGIIVSNFDETCSYYEQVLGLPLAPTQEITTEVWTPDGRR